MNMMSSSGMPFEQPSTSSQWSKTTLAAAASTSSGVAESLGATQILGASIAAHQMASTSATQGSTRRRGFASARIQPTRVKKVMQSDEEIGRMMHSVPVAVGSAMEHFAARLLETSAECVRRSGAKTLTPAHLKQAVGETAQFAFLKSLLKDVGPATPAVVATTPTDLGSPIGAYKRQQKLQHPNKQSPIDHSPLFFPAPSASTAFLPPVQSGGPPNILHLPPPSGELVVKRKRGRPRKEERDRRKERFIDDQELFQVPLVPLAVVGTSTAAQRTLRGVVESSTSNGRNGGGSDAALMPPPRLPPRKQQVAEAVAETAGSTALSGGVLPMKKE